MSNKRQPPVTITCPVCQRERTMPMAWFRKVKTPACSRHCQGVLNGHRWATYGHTGRAAWTPESNAKQRAAVGPRNPHWKGGRRLRSDGYIEVLKPEHPRAKSNGYVLEHILVVETTLGRSLNLGEVVHHKDRNQTNNDPANLQTFPSNAEHRRAHGATAAAAL